MSLTTTDQERQLREKLADVREIASLAAEAIDDQREGDLARRIVELHTEAAALLHLVSTW